MLYGRWLLSDCIQPDLMPVGMHQAVLMSVYSANGYGPTGRYAGCGFQKDFLTCPLATH